ncbi:MAG: hypothetical protein JNL67_12110 [Planctomycetaceae bacterium]|nr:hypothetical protein [Planctomycetaceae bacterium]
MRFCSVFIWTSIGLIIGLGEQAAWGQVTVQLPQFRRFQVNGSVMVPDGGSAYMGGISRSGAGSRQSGVVPFRPFANRTIGGESGNAVVVTSVEVFSLRDMEAQLMGQLSPEYQQQLAMESVATRGKASQQLADDQAKFSALVKNKTDAKIENAKADVRWARKFAAEGNRPAADMFYRQAIKALPAELAELASEEHRKFLDSSRIR